MEKLSRMAAPCHRWEVVGLLPHRDFIMMLPENMHQRNLRLFKKTEDRGAALTEQNLCLPGQRIWGGVCAEDLVVALVHLISASVRF